MSNRPRVKLCMAIVRVQDGEITNREPKEISTKHLIANKIKTAIETNLFTDLNLNITASFGVTQLVNEDDDESLIARADKHLYEAKNSGKNKVIATK